MFVHLKLMLPVAVKEQNIISILKSLSAKLEAKNVSSSGMLKSFFSRIDDPT